MELEFKTFSPSDILKPYVKYYWLCTCDEDVSMEVMYPSGCVELCIDISNGNTIRHFGERSVKMPCMEVLGHFTQPTRASVTKGTTVLVTRFHPYAGALFFSNQASQFTNDSIDLCDIFNNESIELRDRLMEQPPLQQKIKLLEAFLMKRLKNGEKRMDKFKLVESLCSSIYDAEDSFRIENLAAQYGFSERYIQKLFLEWVGLTPKRFQSIHRFNKSLELIQSSNSTLTSIAHECGYYDQAHFIKEFKSYAGMTPKQPMKELGMR